MNRLTLATIVGISVAACGLNGDAMFLVLYSLIFWVLAILSETRAVETQIVAAEEKALTRYEQVELMTGIGWGSKREELRAHLLGVWRLPDAVGQAASGETVNEQPTSRLDWSMMMGLAGLVVAAVGALLSWHAVVVGLVFTAVVQYRATARWVVLRAIPLNGCLVVASLVFFFGPVMAALFPAILIFVRSEK